MPEIVPTPDMHLENIDLHTEANEYLAASRAQNTTRAYKSDWAGFVVWCELQGREPLPATPETVALYLTDLARTHKPTTIQRKMSSITQAHVAAVRSGDSPTKSHLVQQVWKGIARTKRVAPKGKTPLLPADIQAIAHHLTPYILSQSLKATRDCALLLLGFTGAMRRSELVALEREDITETTEGLVVQIRRSKTDQEGVGRKIGIPYGKNPETCPVHALKKWCVQGEITSGPLFRKIDRHGNVGTAPFTSQSVALLLKHYATVIGRDASEFSGHSLRSGLATSAAMAGVPERVIQEQTGHKSLVMLRRYIRDGSLFRENAVDKLGL